MRYASFKHVKPTRNRIADKSMVFCSSAADQNKASFVRSESVDLILRANELWESSWTERRQFRQLCRTDVSYLIGATDAAAQSKSANS
jgi:hypothetical protein